MENISLCCGEKEGWDVSWLVTRLGGPHASPQPSTGTVKRHKLGSLLHSVQTNKLGQP